ncbi:MAG: response regulator [Anaerolineae bacterium]
MENATQTVMLIEDNTDLVFVLQQLIEAAGYEVQVSLDGDDAWSKLERGEIHPDVILCDLSLPGIDGLTLLRRVRSHESTRQVRFIAMSGSIGEQTTSLNAGANQYLLKPFGIRELEDVL